MTESLSPGAAREFTTGKVPWRSYIAGGCLGLCGILFAIAVFAGVISVGGGERILFGGLGLFFFLVGIGLPIAIFFFRKTQAITCRPDGFTVRTEWGGRPGQQRDYRWEAVTSTSYSEVRGKAGTRTRRWRFILFKVETHEGEAFAVDEQISDLPGLIQIFNTMTPHLPYAWQPPTGSAVGAAGSAGEPAPSFVQMPRTGMAAPTSAAPPPAMPPLPTEAVTARTEHAPASAALPPALPSVQTEVVTAPTEHAPASAAAPMAMPSVRAETVIAATEREPLPPAPTPSPSSQPAPQSFAAPMPADAPPRSKLPWILGGCGCLTLLAVIAAAVVGFWLYKNNERNPARPISGSASPAPSRAPSAAPATAATKGFGTLSVHNGGELFRTASVTEAEATKLGNFLVQTGFFDGVPKSVQLNKTGTTYEFRVVASQQVADDPAYAETSKTFAGYVSTQVFNGNPVVIHLCDAQFQTLRVITMQSSSTAAPIAGELLRDELNTFVSTLENAPEDDHRRRFVPFRLRYPSSFRIEKREHTTYVGLYRYTATGSNMGNIEVTWYEAEEGTKAEVKRDLDKISKAWAADRQFKYKELKRYRETVNGVEGDAMLFHLTMPDRQGGFVAGGKVILLRKPGDTKGVIISVYNTWEDPKIKSAADVGVTDELATILRSFEFL